MINEQVSKYIIEKHSHKKRKSSNLPYFFHCFDVVGRLGKWGVKDEKTLIAAGLHDVLEENLDVNKDDLAKIFGDEIASIVQELTFIPVPNGKEKEQKDEYMRTFINKSIQSLIIKMPDRLCNLEDFYHADFSYAKKYCLKASNLFYAFECRKNEVIDFYGEKVYNACQQDLQNMLYKFGMSQSQERCLKFVGSEDSYYEELSKLEKINGLKVMDNYSKIISVKLNLNAYEQLSDSPSWRLV